MNERSNERDEKRTDAGIEHCECNCKWEKWTVSRRYRSAYVFRHLLKWPDTVDQSDYTVFYSPFFSLLSSAESMLSSSRSSLLFSSSSFSACLLWLFQLQFSVCECMLKRSARKKKHRHNTKCFGMSALAHASRTQSIFLCVLARSVPLFLFLLPINRLEYQ